MAASADARSGGLPNTTSTAARTRFCPFLLRARRRGATTTVVVSSSSFASESSSDPRSTTTGCFDAPSFSDGACPFVCEGSSSSKAMRSSPDLTWSNDVWSAKTRATRLAQMSHTSRSARRSAPSWRSATRVQSASFREAMVSRPSRATTYLVGREPSRRDSVTATWRLADGNGTERLRYGSNVMDSWLQLGHVMWDRSWP
mmetsp:Transcript_11922/g.35823  ORF Transcript_11922/g.35823 Transcript_11922/m.35823 type:complete len:201 (+) Transcript_11922:1219-1821(+)